MKKILILINPIAGHGYGPRIQQFVAASGIESAYDITIIPTQYAKHAIQLSADAVKEKFDAVIAVGGDGTVNEIASALVNTDTALGIIPAGSGNGFARHIGMKLKPLDALIQIKNAKTILADTISINNRFAINVSGFGFDGYVAWIFNKQGKRGLSNYTKIAMREYFKYAGIDFELLIDDHAEKKSAHMLVIANASQFGNAAIIAPSADIKDGLMELVIVRKPPFYEMPAMFYRLFTGKLKNNSYVSTLKCRKFSAIASRPVHLHIDGEGIDPLNKIEVEIKPASLKVLMP